ncbi:MAG: 16S rRNA processing protein RimM [Synergistaceae bacterium]|nr:16S rRNA processing protein RimM [Candidatus Equadaptatus faecalis]
MSISKRINSERVVIGKIAAAHGVKGTMLIFPLTDFPERFLDMEELVLEKPGKTSRTLKVKSIAPYSGKGTFFLNAEGINSMDEAELLKGSLITVDKSERVELSENEFWTDDLKGMKVLDSETGEALGKLEEIMETGSNDVYLIRTADGSLKPLPAIKTAVQRVDVGGKTLYASVPEGLWD